MLTKIKVDKIQLSSQGCNLAHLIITLDTSGEPDRFKYDTTWKLQCTGFGIVVKGDNNIDSLKWFLDIVEKKDLETKIRGFATDVIKAQELINTEKTITFKAPARKKAPAKRRI